jgi:hypothetical protein
MARNSQHVQAGSTIVNAALTGTGRAATLFAAQEKAHTDIQILVITSSTTTAQATLSDGTNSYVFNVAAESPVVLSLITPLKSSNLNTAWMLNAPSTMNVVAQAIVVSN